MPYQLGGIVKRGRLLVQGSKAMTSLVPLLVLLLFLSISNGEYNPGGIHKYHPSKYAGTIAGPPDPSTLPDIMSKFPTNTFCGGPYDDYTTGAAQRFRGNTYYHFGKGGDNLMDTQFGNDVVFGGNGNDAIFTETGNDTIICGPGDEVVYTGSGNDYAWGGPGNDKISGLVSVGQFDPNNDDWFSGGPGDDMLDGYIGNDELYGDDGNDKLNGGDGNDILFGDAGDDILLAGPGNDYMDGGPGADMIKPGTGNDIIIGGPGNDTIWTNEAGSKTIYFNASACGEQDTVVLGATSFKFVVVTKAPFTKGFAGLTFTARVSAKYVYVGILGCRTPFVLFQRATLSYVQQAKLFSFSLAYPRPPSWAQGRLLPPVPGVNGIPLPCPDDVMQGADYSDIIFGAQNGANWTNYMQGGDLFDYLRGGPGPDVIIGGNHHDTIYGGDGDDLLAGDIKGQVGGMGVLWGEGGNDALFGGQYRDVLYGGPGSNWLTGNQRGDFFYVDAPTICSQTETDIITDFSGPDPHPEFGQDVIRVVGSLTSITQLQMMTATDYSHTNISVKGCVIPFVMVNYAGYVAITSTNLGFTTQDKIWRIDVGARGGDFINFLLNDTYGYHHGGGGGGVNTPPTPKSTWPPPAPSNNLPA